MKFADVRSKSSVLSLFPFNSEKKRGGVAVQSVIISHAHSQNYNCFNLFNSMVYSHENSLISSTTILMSSVILILQLSNKCSLLLSQLMMGPYSLITMGNWWIDGWH